MHSEQLDQLATALAKAQAEFTAIPKGSENPFFKSSYAALPQVVETASPIITKHGLSVSQFLGYDDGEDTLTTWLLHNSGQYICQTMRLHLTKQDAQGQGSATTYAKRYSYMAVLGLVADEDDDGNAASAHTGSYKAAGQAPRRTGDNAASEKQINLIRVLSGKAGLDPTVTETRIKTIETSKQASEAIEKLNALVERRENEQ